MRGGAHIAHAIARIGIERKRERTRERAREKERKKETEKVRKSEGMREYDISPIRPRHKRAICNAIVREHQCGERKKWRKVEW